MINRKIQYAVIVFVAVISFGGVGFAATRSMASAKSGAGSDQAVHHVSLTDHGANPTAIAIPKDQFVQFDTEDGQQHEISQGSGDDAVHQEVHMDVHEHLSDGKDSGVFGAGESYRVQFHQAGTFNFHDHFNPKVSITVVVYESSGRK